MRFFGLNGIDKMINHKAPIKWRRQAEWTTRLSLKRYELGCDFDQDWGGLAGGTAVYFPLGEIGAKVFKIICRKHRKKSGLRRSSTWRLAVKEFEILCLVQSSGFTPIPICVKPIKINEAYYPAVFMQHIDGEPISGGRYKSEKERDRKKQRLFEKFGVELSVDHENHNMIESPSGLYFVDFEPFYVEVT